VFLHGRSGGKLTKPTLAVLTSDENCNCNARLMKAFMITRDIPRVVYQLLTGTADGCSGPKIDALVIASRQEP
jgi:hypothetical protein